MVLKPFLEHLRRYIDLADTPLRPYLGIPTTTYTLSAQRILQLVTLRCPVDVLTWLFRPIRAHLTLLWNVHTTLELGVGGQSKGEDEVGRSLLGVQNVEISRNQPADELIVASVKRDDSIDHAPAIWQFLFEKGTSGVFVHSSVC